MSDLIRRQDLIDCLTSRIEVLEGVYGDLGGAVSGVREMVKVMPSAEPEEEVFEWCHDCKEYDQEKHCCHRWTKVIRQTIEEMKTESERRWIPVTERLPEEDIDVLLQFPKNMGVGYQEDGFWNIVTGNDMYCGLDKGEAKPIAWMPLPEPWRGE